MPNGTGQGIARGIEVGVQNFLQNFMAVKQFKEANKYKKLGPVIDIINAQIADPNTPLDQKIKAMDTLPGLLGAKNDIPLSVMLGLDKLAAQEMEVGEQTVQEQKGGLVEDEVAVEANKRNLKVGNTEIDQVSTDNIMATSIETKPTKSLKKKLLKRRGEMSATDINIAKQVQINRSEQEDQFQRQYKLAQLNAELQSKTLAQQGWKNNGDWTYNAATKTWQQEWFNPINKESYQQRLEPGVVPETVILKQIQANSSGSGGGVSKAYSTLEHSIATSMGLPQDDPRVKLRTAQVWRDNYESTVTNKQQNITGTEPIQPNQQFDNSMQVLQAQQNHDRLVADAAASLGNVESLSTRKGQAWQNAADAKVRFDKLVNEDELEPGDAEYDHALSQYNQARDDANRLESEYQNALKAHNSLNERVKFSEQNLKGVGVNSGSASTSQFSAQMRAAITAVRKANPSTKLTDEQIAERIKSDPKYSHIK